MNEIQPSMLSVLCTIKTMAEVHRMLLKERQFAKTSERLKHAEFVLNRVYQHAERVLQKVEGSAASK